MPKAAAAGAAAPGLDTDLDLTILMPCLNEAETLAICIRKAQAYLAHSGLRGEVLIADNGSTDGSQQIAEAEGARVVAVPRRGYGAALIGGVAAARGRWIIMGDADDSYDFSALEPFVTELRTGADLVMGNRFAGGVAPGAMPWLHRYVGNPVLSGIGRLFFRTRINDFHCGLRGFVRDRIAALRLRTTGMEHASEMVVRAALSDFDIREVPTTLKPDGRTRAPHLRTWRDGWRHLSFLLMYSPRWLFLYPGLYLLGLGLAAVLILLPGAFSIVDIAFDIRTFIVACFCTLLGIQAICFAVVARRYSTTHKLAPPSKRYQNVLRGLTLERVLLATGLLFAISATGFVFTVLEWSRAGFGDLAPTENLRLLILSLTGIAVSIQVALTAFLSAITEVPTQ